MAYFMNRDRKPHRAPWFPVNVVAAVGPKELPAVPFQAAGQPLTGNRFHTTISRTLSLIRCLGCSISAERQPSTASWTFFIRSSSVSP